MTYTDPKIPYTLSTAESRERISRLDYIEFADQHPEEKDMIDALRTVAVAQSILTDGIRQRVNAARTRS